MGDVFGGEPCGDPESDNSGDILGAGTAAPFLTAAAEQRLDLDAVADDQGADALWSPQLVCRQGDQIGAEIGDIDVDLACGLYGIAMDQRSVAVRQCCRFGHRLHNASTIRTVYSCGLLDSTPSRTPRR